MLVAGWMQCSGCGTENSGPVKFCAECGAPMGIPCPQCAFRNARGAADCGRCGVALNPERAPTAERRQLTVFFADIVGSTALAESLDPEDLRELYARYQSICAETVARYEGHVAQYLGDGVLVYFGYPAAHEDDASRAVRTALDILARIATVSIHGHRPFVRIGIHTGAVVVGDVGGGARREQLALGEAPNIAARLQSEALPDTVVISDATRRLLAGQFALEELGSRTLKGVSRPLQLYRVLGASTAASRFQAMKKAHGLTPFVGRHRETELIRSAWAAAASGKGRTLLLIGEAGIGKSRLLEAAEQISAGDLHEVFQAQCSPYHRNSALHPVVAMIERRTGIEDSMPDADKLDLIEQFTAGRGVRPEQATPVLAELLSIPALGRYLEIEIPPAKRLQRAIETLVDLLIHSVGRSPILLLCEDLHWADPSTLDLVAGIVARQTDVPVMVIGTARPEFSAAWLQHPNCVPVHVAPLTLEDTRELVANVAGGKPLPLALREELILRTGGIPLFVEAVTRSIIEAGILRELDDRYELTGPLPAGMIPASVQDSLMARIDRLGPDRPVAQLAATIGRESGFELLQAVFGRPADELSRALKHLVSLELVDESGTPPASTYTFKHALIQDAAYESLLRKTRQEFHARIAEVLSTRFPDAVENSPALLARHFEGAGRIEEATALWMKAAAASEHRSAMRESAGYLNKALSLLETRPEDDPHRLQSEMDVQLALAKTLTSSLGWGSREVEAACLRARDLCIILGNGPGLVGMLLGLSGMYLLRGRIPQALESARPVLDMALASKDPMLDLAARHTAGYAAYFLADFSQASEHARIALASYEPERDRQMAAVTRSPSSFACANFLAMSLWFTGYPDQAEQMRIRSLAMVEAINIPDCTAFGLGSTLLIHFARRDYAAAAPIVERLIELATDQGYFFWIGWGRIYRGWVQAMAADADAGIAEMKAGLDSYRQTGSGLATPQFCLMMAEAQVRAGRHEEALESLAVAMRHAVENQERVHEPDLHRVKGEILLACGEREAAEASLQLAIQIARDQQARMLELRAAVSLARAQDQVGSEPQGRALVASLHSWFQEGFDTPELLQARTFLESAARLAQNA